MLARSKRPAWLRVDQLLGEWGISEDSPAGRQRLERALAELIIAEDLKRWRWQEADLKTRPKGGQ